MSDTPQIPVQETKAENVKPLELSADSAVPSTGASEPLAAGENKAEEPTALPQPTTETAAAEEPLKDEKKGAEPVTAGVLGYKAPGLLK